MNSHLVVLGVLPCAAGFVLGCILVTWKWSESINNMWSYVQRVEAEITAMKEREGLQDDEQR